MPSGFQQDSNQLSPAYFRVVIDMSGNNTEWWTMSSNGGTITHTGKITTFSWDSAAGSDLPATQLISDALSRGNLRFQAIVEELGRFGDCQILDIENGANSISADQVDQNIITFTVKYDRPNLLFPCYNAFLKTLDLGDDGTITVDGVTYLAYNTCVGNGYVYGNEDVVKDLVMRALIRNAYNNGTWTRSTRVFVPLEGSDPLTGAGVQREIQVARPFDNASDAWNDITVTEINGISATESFDC